MEAKRIVDSSIWDDPKFEMPTNLIHDAYMKCLEDCIKAVMAQYLGRVPVLEDAKRVTIGQNPNWDYMLIAIDGTSLGRIETKFGPSMNVTFTPHRELELKKVI